jgi:hypothetical protein
MGQQASVYNMKEKEKEDPEKEKNPWRPMRKEPDSKVIFRLYQSHLFLRL